MSDTDAFNAVLQKELKAIAERSLQIENLNALNMASYATIKDVFTRHPALVTQQVDTFEALDKIQSLLIKEYKLLPEFGLVSDKIVTDKDQQEWYKVKDISEAQLLADVLTKLFADYMSPSVAGRMEFGIVCRGFIKPSSRDGNIDTDDYSIMTMVLFSETVEVDNDWILTKTGMYRTSFYTYEFNGNSSNRVWYSVRVNDDVHVVYDLNAKSEKEFATLYIRNHVTDFNKDYFDQIFKDLSNELSRIAIYAATHPD